MKRKEKTKSMPIRMLFTLMKIAVIAVIVVISINVYVIKTTEDFIKANYRSEEYVITAAELEEIKQTNPQCILVLGASVNSDGTPSPMLRDRLDTAIDLYNKGAAPKLLMTGDNGQVVYNEVAAMKNYAMEKGVAEEDIFLDHAGFSTYESVYRANHIFKVERMVVVTQKYHIYRALYGCRSLGMEAVGVASDQYEYAGQEKREVREVLARNKDCIKWLFKLEPTFLGDEVPIGGGGQ